MSKRTMIGLALAAILASATATLAQKKDAVRPASSREVGPFVRAGGHIFNLSRVEHLTILGPIDGDRMLDVYLMGNPTPAGRVRAKDATALFEAMGLPPLDGPGA